jgi:beta-glucosidase
MLDMKKFPQGFYWGAATASYQVEGGIENCDWAKAAREGKVPTAGRSSDHYNRYEEDFNIAKRLGHNAHRFSIEWARIEPEEGKFDEKEIEHYRNVLRALHSRGMTPFITLWHFTLPLWFSESGGFERKDSPEIFARYCKFVVERLGDLCGHFVTINEPEIYTSLGWIRGAWPPFKRFSLIGFSKEVTNEHRETESSAKRSLGAFFLFLRVLRNLSKSHNLAYQEIKSTNGDAKVSIVKHVHVFDSNANPLNILKKKVAHYFLNQYLLSRVHHCLDYLSLNYYRYTKFGDDRNYPKSDMGWNLNPEKIYWALMYLSDLKKPIIISETGIADEDDSDRAAYITTQLEVTWQAIQDGADVRGYMYWSLLDNYEWDLGYEKRFGLVEINYDTLERKVRPSAYVYRDICLQNGFPVSTGN